MTNSPARNLDLVTSFGAADGYLVDDEFVVDSGARIQQIVPELTIFLTADGLKGEHYGV